MRGLVAELSHVIAAKVERGSAQYIFRQRNVSECVFALYGPGENFPFSDRFVLTVVYLQTVKIVVTSESFAVHHPPKVEVSAPIGIGGHIACVVGQQESESRTEIGVSMLRTACCDIRRLLNHSRRRFGNLVVVQVNLRTCEEIAFPQPEQKPRIHLNTAISVFTRIFPSRIVLVCVISDTVEVFDGVFVGESAEYAETVAFEEELRLCHEIEPSVEYQRDGHGYDGTSLGGVARIHPERHQRATAHQKTEIGCVAGTSQNVVMQIPLRHTLAA